MTQILNPKQNNAWRLDPANSIALLSLPAGIHRVKFEYWILDFVCYLVLGIWIFLLFRSFVISCFIFVQTEILSRR